MYSILFRTNLQMFHFKSLSIFRPYPVRVDSQLSSEYLFFLVYINYSIICDEEYLFNCQVCFVRFSFFYLLLLTLFAVLFVSQLFAFLWTFRCIIYCHNDRNWKKEVLIYFQNSVFQWVLLLELLGWSDIWYITIWWKSWSGWLIHCGNFFVTMNCFFQTSISHYNDHYGFLSWTSLFSTTAPHEFAYKIEILFS